MKSFLATLAALTLILLFTMPFVVGTPYTLQLVTIALLWVLMAQGLNVVQGETGYVSIAQAGFMGIGAYTSALLSLNYAVPVWASMAIATAVTGLLAAIIGYPSVRVRGHYFAIVTLAYNLVIFIVLMNAVSITRGEGGLTDIKRPEALRLDGIEISFDGRAAYYYVVLVVALAGFVLAWRISRSGFGQVLRSIRQNETLAEALGVRCRAYKLTAFAISATYAGAAGALYAHFIGFINPAPFAPEGSLNAILAVILGGSGTVTGPALGAFIVTFVPEFLRIDETTRFIVYGLLLIIATIYLPRGIVPMLAKLQNAKSHSSGKL